MDIDLDIAVSVKCGSFTRSFKRGLGLHSRGLGLISGRLRLDVI